MEIKPQYYKNKQGELNIGSESANIWQEVIGRSSMIVSNVYRWMILFESSLKKNHTSEMLKVRNLIMIFNIVPFPHIKETIYNE